MSWTIIKTQKQYLRALDRLEDIFDTKNNTKNSDEFDLLTMLVNRFESEQFEIEEADPIMVIKMKMDYMGLKQKDLIPFFGSKSTTSKILSYKAPLTLKHIWILSEELNLPVQLLAKPYRVDDWGFMKKFDKSITNQIKANA